VGAVIGFITNVVAIRMLFRPLREIRVFGIRLPFTPGILPRQRHRLAQSIGGMVERELLTPEILRQRLGREDVREKIRASISLFTAKVLCKTPGELFPDRENFLSAKLESTTEKLYPRAASAVIEFLRRDEIRRELEAKGRVILSGIILKLNVFQRIFLSAGQYDSTLNQKMPEIIEELLVNADNLLNDAAVKKKIVNAASDAFSRMAEQDKTISALLDIGEDDKKKLDNFLFEKVMTEADRQIENLLASIDVKALVADRINSLEMLRVERIILDVMADQLKWIDIFGAILGFLIGLFQTLFNLLMR
jgi:uncharacterized membrane protein YheB (UPF0754 family)